MSKEIEIHVFTNKEGAFIAKESRVGGDYAYGTTASEALRNFANKLQPADNSINIPTPKHDKYKCKCGETFYTEESAAIHCKLFQQRSNHFITAWPNWYVGPSTANVADASQTLSEGFNSFIDSYEKATVSAPASRVYTNQEAIEAAMALINHFHGREGSKVLIGIPARPTDTDMVLIGYLKQVESTISDYRSTVDKLRDDMNRAQDVIHKLFADCLTLLETSMKNV